MTDIVETRQNELKKKKICRFCLSQDGADLTNIYSRENRTKSAPLPLQVMACVSIEVFSNDCMPSYVCTECRITFDYCYRFKQMCKKADTCLRHYPLTGIWSAAMEKPTIPSDLVKKQQQVLNVQTVKSDTRFFEKIEIESESYGNFVTLVAEPQEPQDQEELLQPEPEEPEPQQIEPQTQVQPKIEPQSESLVKVQAKPKVHPKFTMPLKDKPSHRVLNKSAIRILNKEAQVPVEPRMSKPVLKRDNEGNIALVSEILDPNERSNETDPVESAEVIETNVFPCPHCERSFPLHQLLEIHMVNHRRERSFNCNDCNKSFFSKYDLQKHILVHTGEKPFTCVVCNKGFTRSTLLHRHEKTHTDIPKFICVFCEKPFISQKEMEKHTERHRKNRPFTCKICDKSFAFKQGLERHEVVHCRFQPFQCQYCEKSYSTPSKLSRHLTAHAGARPYPCKLCPKAYLLSHHLTRHMRSHKNGTGSYKCSDCDKTFSSRDDLIYHSAVHATQTLICPLCKDEFEDIETVTEHVKQHAEGEAYACEFCDLIFMTAERLEDHTDADHFAEMVVYNEDDQANVAAEKKNEAKNSKVDDSENREIDEVIEEFLIDEFSDVGSNGDTGIEKPSSIIIKEETEWQTEDLDTKTVVNEFDASQEHGSNSIVDEADYTNIIDMSEAVEEPPAKVTKVSATVQQVTKRAPPATTPLRHKPPIKPVAPAKLSPPSPKENKKPVMAAKPVLRTKVEVVTPKTRQPTIQSALQGLSKSLSIKKITPPLVRKDEPKSVLSSKSVVTTTPVNKLPTTAVPAMKKPAPKASLTTPSESNTKQSPQTAARLLRQRSEVSPSAKLEVKASTSSPEAAKKPQPETVPVVEKKSPANVPGTKKIVEMMIGDKRVKVQRITMSKAQAAAMEREGRIQMKEGTMILTKEPVVTKTKK